MRRRTCAIARSWLGLSAMALAWACGEPHPVPNDLEVDVVEHFADPPGGRASSSSIRFDDGTIVRDIEVEPVPVEPGGTVTVRLQVEGPPMSLRIGLLPPRLASHQVALGGVDAPDPEPPADERARFLDVEPDAENVEVTLPVPAPWHPATAVLTLERHRGETRYAAVTGPRLHDGRAVLAVVPVAAAPTTVSVAHLSRPPQIDGSLDEAAWSSAAPHSLVHSLDGEPAPREVRTQVRFGWDANHLYVAGALDDADLRSSFQRQDEPLWKEEVFELFIFGDDRRQDYLELQVSPRGVSFDARFERYRSADEAWDSAWVTAVDARGSVDDPSDRDRGWSVEAAVPWDEICTHTDVQCPPAAGMQLRANVFRLERPRHGATIGLALSPPGVPDFHAPERSAVLELAP